MTDNAFNARVRELLSAAMQLAKEKPEILSENVAEYWVNTPLDVLVEHIGKSTLPAVRRLCADLEWSVGEMLEAMGPLPKDPGEYIILVEDLDTGRFWSYIGSSKDLDRRCRQEHGSKAKRDREQTRYGGPGKYLYNVIDQPGKNRKVHMGSLAIFDRAVFHEHPVLQFTLEGLFQLMLRSENGTATKYRDWLNLPGVGITNGNVTGTCQSVPFSDLTPTFDHRKALTGLPRKIIEDVGTWRVAYCNSVFGILKQDRAILEAWGVKVGDSVTLRFDITDTPEQQEFPWIYTRKPPPGLERASLLGLHLSGNVTKANNSLEPGDTWGIWLQDRRLQVQDETRLAQAAMSFIEHVEGTYVVRPDRLNLTRDAREEPVAPLYNTPEEKEAYLRGVKDRDNERHKKARASLSESEKAALNERLKEGRKRRMSALPPEEREQKRLRTNERRNISNASKPPKTAEQKAERNRKLQEQRRTLYANETPEQAEERRASYKAKKAKYS